MHWVPPWQQRPPRPPRPPAPVPSAALALMARDKYENMPLGGWAGEMLSAAPPEPAPPAPEPFVIPPPPWADELARGDFDLAAALHPPEPEPQMTALEAMKAQHEDYDPPFAAGPIVTSEPLRRPEFPKPDWRAEEKKAAAQNRLERVEHALQTLRDLQAEEQPARYPPPQRPPE